MSMFKAALIAAVGLAVAANAAQLTTEQYQFLFSRYITEQDKKYTIEETFKRFEVFKSNVDLIVAHNARGASWTAGVNAFTDLTASEFAKMMGFKPISIEQEAANMMSGFSTTEGELLPADPRASLQDSPDWASHLTGVKNQGSCGSCYSFSSTQTLTGAVSIKTGKKIDFSDQQVVDCSRSFGNQGCNGGLMSNTYRYIVSNGGICDEASYPYTAKDGQCKATTCKPAVKITGHKIMDSGVNGLATGLKTGPVAVALAAGNSAFQMYRGGVLDGCNSVRQDHAVVATHYSAGGNYLHIRNSWGSSWGEQGHIRISTKGDMCGLGASRQDAQPTL